jgi:DNA-directed RNA polymerase specialized sigma24 family protein
VRDDLRCDCNICEVEGHIFDLLAEPPGNARFLSLTAGSPVLAKFTNVSELLAYLHSPRTGDFACSDTGHLLTALVAARTTVPDSELIHSLLVLAFAPTIHRTYREVCAWFRELEAEDVAQQILAFFLELLVSAVAENPMDILPIALSRSLRKTCFRWAEKEQRALSKRQDKTQTNTGDHEQAAEATFETVSVLNDFLDYCSRHGLLSRFERELLIKFKVDGFSGKEIQNRHTVLTEQAVHLRVHRIMQRLQDAALTLGAKARQSNNVDQTVPAQSRKSHPCGKDFSMKDSASFLPISNG